jgi:RNA polymerase sigma-70 factor (ECF subfamily)
VEDAYGASTIEATGPQLRFDWQTQRVCERSTGISLGDARSQIAARIHMNVKMAVDLSDEELLSGAGAEGFALLYERRYPLVRGYLHRRVGPHPDLVLDLVAETFARALEHRDQFDPQRGTAVAWLLGIARNLLLEAVRRGRVADASRRLLGMEPIVIGDEQLELLERESTSELERSLSHLPSGQREAIERRVLDEEPYAAIAAGIGCSEQVVRKRVSRGLAALRRRIKESA